MKNYKLLILLFGFTLFVTSCKKEEETKDDTEETTQQLNKGEIVSDPAPSQFTKKVLIEEFTGEWCGYCPDGAARIASIKQNHQDLVFAISYHDSDPFETPVTNLYEGLLNVPFFPSAAIDRVPYQGDLSFSRSYWANVTNERLAVTADMGIKLETHLTGNNLTVTVKLAAKQDHNDLYLTVALVEDNVPESSPGAQSGAAAGYVHQDVLRNMVTDNRGDLVTLVANKVVAITYDNINFNYRDINNIHVIAFLHEKVDTQGKEIYNVQGVKAGETHDFD